jgi:hypothetical protein
MKTRPNSAYTSPSRTFPSSPQRRPLSASSPTRQYRSQNSSLRRGPSTVDQTSYRLTQRNGALSPTHRDVYKKLIIDAVHTINCPILYRTLLKMEKVFQSNSKAKHRFIKMVYLCACNENQDIDPLADFLKSHMGVCISLAECRQLVLYCSLFGDTSSPTPSKENMKQVVTRMYLHVPQLFYYQKWCRDVKRLEIKKNGGNKPITGYFSNKWKSTYGDNSLSDISGLITNNSDDASRHSQNSYPPNGDQDGGIISDDMMQDARLARQTMIGEAVTSSRHIAMLQAIANGEEDDEVVPVPPKPKAINRFKKIALSLVAVGSDLSLFSPDPQNGIPNHTPFQGHKRKTGQSNVYMLSDAPEYRKLVATLAKGDAVLSPTAGVIINHPKSDEREHLSWKSSSNHSDSYDADDSPPIGSYGFTPGLGGSGKSDTTIFNIKGDPIKDGYYVDAASRVEVLNFLDPKYSTPPPQSPPVVAATGHQMPKLQTSSESLDQFENQLLPATDKSGPRTTFGNDLPLDSSPATMVGSRKFSKSYSQTLLDEDETILREALSSRSPSSSSPVTPKGSRKSLNKPSSARLSFKSPQQSGNGEHVDLMRKMSILDENDDSYQLNVHPPRQSTPPKKRSINNLTSLSFSSSPSWPPEPSVSFATASTVGLAKLRLLKKMKQSKSPPQPSEESAEHTSPPRSRSSSSNHL